MAHLTIPVTKKDHIQGLFNAPVTLVEYGDYQCPYCRMVYFVIKQIEEELGDSLRFVFRNFPLKEVHPYALMAAQVAEAAALQNKFWEMHDLIYENQDALSQEALLNFAEQLELNMKKFRSDVQSPTVMNKIEEDFRGGVHSGVNGTPTFFINGERYQGDYSFDALMQALAVEQR
jgi:protein-disulfide isomerase